MTWCGRHPKVARITKTYLKKVRVSKAEMKIHNTRLQRSEALPKYDITIKPQLRNGR
jgi:hypothetical protein